MSFVHYISYVQHIETLKRKALYRLFSNCWLHPLYKWFVKSSNLIQWKNYKRNTCFHTVEKCFKIHFALRSCRIFLMTLTFICVSNELYETAKNQDVSTSSSVIWIVTWGTRIEFIVSWSRKMFQNSQGEILSAQSCSTMEAQAFQISTLCIANMIS